MDSSHPNNFFKPHFTTTEVLKLVGVQYETLRRWLKLGYICPSMENPGRGRQRLYSLSDIIQIATIHLLAGVGFLPSWFSSTIAKCANSLALLKIMEDYAHAQGLELKYEYGPSEFFKDDPEKLAEFEEMATTINAMAAELKIDLPVWTAEDRYILIFENTEGEIESKVLRSPYLERGVWVTIDVHGILNEAMGKIAGLK